jgi:hypothetical protein
MNIIKKYILPIVILVLLVNVAIYVSSWTALFGVAFGICHHVILAGILAFMFAEVLTGAVVAGLMIVPVSIVAIVILVRYLNRR